MIKGKINIFKLLFGMFPGVISGFVLGVLLAPKSGKETREELKEITEDKFRELQEISQGKVITTASSFKRKASRISSKLDELSKRGSDILIQDEVQ